MEGLVCEMCELLFYQLEGEALLNPDDDADIQALHITCLPKLQDQLDSFWLGWCHHCLRTEHNMTPHHLWLQRMLQQEPDSMVISGLNDSEVHVSCTGIIRGRTGLCCYVTITWQIHRFMQWVCVQWCSQGLQLVETMRISKLYISSECFVPWVHSNLLLLSNSQ